jgi:hypothetical protein
MTTGFNIREGSAILAERRAEKERCEAVAAEMIRRAKVRRLWRRAEFLVTMIEADRRAA